jgi:hypothetical protein
MENLNRGSMLQVSLNEGLTSHTRKYRKNPERSQGHILARQLKILHTAMADRSSLMYHRKFSRSQKELDVESALVRPVGPAGR